MFSVTIHDSKLFDVTNKLHSINISKKSGKSKKMNEAKDDIKGPLDRFVMKEKIKDDSLTLSDFECDSVNLNISDIINGIIT